ncbi:MAG: C4-dicarboxylate ABC transporter, partial [Tistlia sp.]
DYLVVVSAEWWDGLDEEVRNQLGNILAEVTAERNALSTEINEKNRQMILDAGGEIRQLSPEQRAKWVEAMEPVWEEFQGDIGADLISAAQSANQGS